MSDDEAKDLCPECEEGFSQLGVHWARSKECGYPVPALTDRAILDGLMFVGGSLNYRHNPDANCYVSIVHHDHDALSWIADELGVLVNGITEFDAKGSIDYFSGEPDDPLWKFRTRSLPALDRYHSWYDEDGNRSIPEDLEPRPELLKTACLLAARPMDDRPGLYLSLRRTTPAPTTVHGLFEGYGPRIVRNSDDGYVVRINNSTDLCDDLAPWPPFTRDRFDPSRHDAGRLLCPQCGGRFRRPQHLCEFINGGELVRQESASPGRMREMWKKKRRLERLAEAPEYGPADIKRARQVADLTQAELAERLGIAVSTIEHWERGTHRPSARFRAQMQEIEQQSDSPGN